MRDLISIDTIVYESWEFSHVNLEAHVENVRFHKLMFYQRMNTYILMDLQQKPRITAFKQPTNLPTSHRNPF